MKNRLIFLDSTRGLAALCVLLSHFIGAFNLPANLQVLDHSIFHAFWNGKGAVSYFFVLSGFVLSYSYFQNGDSFANINYLNFIVKRFLRIYPTFLVVLFISWICSMYFFDAKKIETLPEASQWIKIFWKEKRSLLNMVKEGALIIRIPQDPEKRLINQDWTLTIEIIVSLMVPIFILIYKHKPIWLLIAIIVLLRLHSDIWIIDFSLGIIIAANADSIVSYYLKTNRNLHFIFFIIALILFSNQFVFDLPASISDLLFKVGNGMLLICFISSHIIQKILTIKPLEFLGHISYPLYLCHFILILTVASPVFNILKDYDITNDIFTRLLALFAVFIGTVLLSWGLSVCIETPFIKLSKELIKKVNNIQR